MDTIILAVALIAFFALVASWVALPASTETAVMPHGAPVRA
jgi:hypothetical protein